MEEYSKAFIFFWCKACMHQRDEDEVWIAADGRELCGVCKGSVVAYHVDVRCTIRRIEDGETEEGAAQEV